MAQVGVTLDGLEQLVGGVDPDPQFVFLVALELRNLVLAGSIGIDFSEVLDDPRQRLGQQPVIDQIQHQAMARARSTPEMKMITELTMKLSP